MKTEVVFLWMGRREINRQDLLLFLCYAKKSLRCDGVNFLIVILFSGGKRKPSPNRPQKDFSLQKSL